LKGSRAFAVPRIPAGGLVVDTDGKSATETAEEIFGRLRLGPEVGGAAPR